MSTDVSIISEHKDFLVVYKPEGLPVHHTHDSHKNTFIQQLRNTLASDSLYPCHRLDQVTSGLLLVAKGTVANKVLSEQFANRQVDKYYLALSPKKPRRKQGLIKGDMEQARNGGWKLSRASVNPAVTQFISFGLGNGLRLFVLKPHTGKTHQLRVALKSEASPILGDERYGGSSADRCYLHAYELGFRYLGEEYHFRCLPHSGAHFGTPAFLEKAQSFGAARELHWPTL